MKIEVNVSKRSIAINNVETCLNTSLELEIHLGKLLARGYLFDTVQSGEGDKVFQYIGPEEPKKAELSYHERLLNLVDQFKVSGLATIHYLDGIESLEYLTTIASHLTMYDTQVALYGLFDWDRSRYVTVKHQSGIITGFYYSAVDNLRAVASKALALQYDLGVANHSPSCYFHRGITADSVLEIICAILDRKHLIEARVAI
jgi:hypothetical protein